uniref:Glycoprotein 3-alpha-L-fucosyltransferase A-like n=1 Tax=Haemonchus contortus TaxID=6289 RepID=A0A7I4YNZ1_HAECO
MNSKRSILMIGALFLTYIFVFYGSPGKLSSISQRIGLSDFQCQCKLDGDVVDFCYHLPPDPKIRGRRFNCTYIEHLENLDLLSNKTALSVESNEFPVPMFVTAMSDNHYKEGLTLIANIRKLWPQKKIVVFNLGLNQDATRELKGKCFVELRDFPFSNYPPYVKRLSHYRWKPLIIAMALKDFGAVWYMDTSVRCKKDRLSQVYDEIRCRKDHPWSNSRNYFKDSNVTVCGKSAYLLHSSSGHGIFPTTNPGVYDYIPTLFPYLKQNTCVNHDAGFAFIVRSADSMNILKWYVLCALEQTCMAPPKSELKCSFKDPFTIYAGCHRNDQSVINLLLANSYEYNSKYYVSNLGAEGASISRTFSKSLKPEDFSCNLTVSYQ